MKSVPRAEPFDLGRFHDTVSEIHWLETAELLLIDLRVVSERSVRLFADSTPKFKLQLTG